MVSLWGDRASIVFELGDVVFFRGVQVSHYNGRCLEVHEKTIVDQNLRDIRAMELWHWYDNRGKFLPVQPLTTAQSRG